MAESEECYHGDQVFQDRILKIVHINIVQQCKLQLTAVLIFSGLLVSM